MKKLLIILTLSFLFCSCTQSKDITSDTLPTTASQMTTEEKVGQMLMVCCDRTGSEYMMSFKPGGILMFAKDFENLTKDEVISKISGYKESSVIEPYIAVDEEGGTVVRVSSNPNLAPEKFESPRFYYAKGGMDAVTDNTKEKSELLTSLGITMNLAPVVDISDNPEDFIYDRSLGTDAKTTAVYAQSTVKAMNEYRVASCLKHFPGYGSNADTHTGIAIDNRSLDSLYENDFIPFKAGIQAGTDAVLVSHNIVTDIDSQYPSSISKPIHDILRNELEFDGIIITDDMSMQAMSGYENPYVKAVLAGNDMIIVSDYDDAYNEILNAVNSGEIPESVIDTAVNRILENKQKNGIN